jgi:hypothetical protein
MSIPTSIKVNGRHYFVARESLDGACGRCDSNIGTIFIAPHEDGFEERDTVLHEVMHAVLRQQGRRYTKAEEVYVTALATGLLGCLRDNPKLTDYLFAP